MTNGSATQEPVCVFVGSGHENPLCFSDDFSGAIKMMTLSKLLSILLLLACVPAQSKSLPSLPNPVEGSALEFTDHGPVLASQNGKQDWRLGLSLIRYGDEMGSQPILPAPAVQSSLDRVEYRRGSIIEWYESRPEGLEQGFTVLRPLRADSQELKLLIDMPKQGLTAHLVESGNSLQWRDAAGQSILSYDELKVFDATGRVLPARLAVKGQHVEIQAKVADAVWPVVVDPLVANIQQKILTFNMNTATSVAISGASMATHSAANYTYGRILVRSGVSWGLQQQISGGWSYTD